MRKWKVPSPGTVLGVIALIVALSGTAYALKLKKNSVGPKQLRMGAVTEAKLAPGAVTTTKLGNGAVTHSKLDTSQQAGWAYVNGTTNDVIGQSGGVSLVAGSGAGEYFVKFPFELLHRGITATLQTAQTSGEVQVGMCGAPAPTTGLFLFCNTTNPSDNTDSVVRVDTSNSSGAVSARNFYVAVTPASI